VLVLPEAACPTGPVYGAFDGGAIAGLDEQRVRRAVSQSVIAGEPREDLLFNDLSEAAQVVAPVLREVIRVVGGATGRRALVTGSGSTVYVVVGDTDEAVRLRARTESALAGAGLGCAVVAARLLG
jgi:4-diphosphocytidyl-2C-methyl-D-erythritol kinase